MIEVSSIQVLNNFSIDYLLVRFQIADTDEDLGQYLFHIYRSHASPESSYERIATTASEFEYKDTGVNLLKTDVKYYYKIEIEDVVTGNRVMSNLYGSLNHRSPDTIAAAILYENEKYLEVIDNDPVYILLRKRFGQRCGACWDDVRMQPTTDDCHECYQTGYSGGYHPPILAKMSYINPPVSSQATASSDNVGQEEGPISIWISNYPIINAGDIVIDSMNNRYNILGVQQTTKNNKFVIRQVITMQKLPPSNIAYQFPILN